MGDTSTLLRRNGSTLSVNSKVVATGSAISGS